MKINDVPCPSSRYTVEKDSGTLRCREANDQLEDHIKLAELELVASSYCATNSFSAPLPSSARSMSYGLQLMHGGGMRKGFVSRLYLK